MTSTSLAELHLSAEQGDAAAQFNLGTAYHKGIHCQVDFVEAAKWYLKAAEQGHMYAQHEIGLLYCHGRGVPEDCTEAKNWFIKAAAQGLMESQTLLKNLEYRITSEKEKQTSFDHTQKANHKTAAEYYDQGVRIAGSLTAIIVFIGSWIYCIATYGFLFGVGLGWLPSGIVAVIAGVVVGFLWPLAALGILLIAIYLGKF